MAADRRRVAAIVPAAGLGLRLGPGLPKALRLLGDEPLVVHALRRLVQVSAVGCIIVCAPPGSSRELRATLEPCLPGPEVQLLVIDGGVQRHDSVAAALSVLPTGPEGPDTVLVHDAARCLTPVSLIEAVAQRVMAGEPAVVPGMALTDTIKAVDPAGLVTATPPRSALRQIQTPQGFRREVLAEGHAWLRARIDAGEEPAVTDDAMLAESAGYPVRVINGSPLALKLTHPHDFTLALALLEES